MSERKLRRVTVQLTPIQIVWLHSQHLFQKIEESTYTNKNQIKFFKNNSGVEIRFQGVEGELSQLIQAKDQLMKVIQDNQIRLITTSIHKDNYIRISKQARKEFPKSYIIFLHYQTFQNCARKLQQKFNITSITPELDRLRKNNPYFCFLIAQKGKIDQIEKFTKRIFLSEVSCASTTFSHRRQNTSQPHNKRSLSVSSLRGSFSDQNQQQYRLSMHQAPIQEQLFEMSESIILKLLDTQMEEIRKRKIYQGCLICTQNYEGSYASISKKLYYANRLQLTANPYIQPIYAYTMVQKTPYRWALTVITDKSYRRLSDIRASHKFNSPKIKIQILLKIARCLCILHRNLQSYGDVCQDRILIYDDWKINLSAVIQKQIPPHTDPFIYDVRKYLILIYLCFTDTDLSYDMLLAKQKKQDYFTSLSHKCKNKLLKDFLDIADQLFIKDITLYNFTQQVQNLLNM